MKHCDNDISFQKTIQVASVKIQTSMYIPGKCMHLQLVASSKSQKCYTCMCGEGIAISSVLKVLIQDAIGCTDEHSQKDLPTCFRPSQLCTTGDVTTAVHNPSQCKNYVTFSCFLFILRSEHYARLKKTDHLHFGLFYFKPYSRALYV